MWRIHLNINSPVLLRLSEHCFSLRFFFFFDFIWNIELCVYVKCRLWPALTQTHTTFHAIIIIIIIVIFRCCEIIRFCTRFRNSILSYGTTNDEKSISAFETHHPHSCGFLHHLQAYRSRCSRVCVCPSVHPSINRNPEQRDQWYSSQSHDGNDFVVRTDIFWLLVLVAISMPIQFQQVLVCLLLLCFFFIFVGFLVLVCAICSAWTAN